MRRLTGMTIAMLMAATAVAAQQPADTHHVKMGPVAASRPRVGYAAAPAPPPPPPRAQTAPPTVYYLPNGGVLFVPTYLILADGSALVNFGNGYERVLRPCASPQVSTPRDPYARDALGRIPEPPGIAALRPGASGQLSGTPPARGAEACYQSRGQASPEIVTTRR